MSSLILTAALMAINAGQATEYSPPIMLVQHQQHPGQAGFFSRFFGLGPNSWARSPYDPRFSPWMYGQNPYAAPYYPHYPPAYPYYPPPMPQPMPAYPQYMPPAYPQAAPAPVYQPQPQALPLAQPSYQIQ
jgi:hypothetical protein